MSQLRNPVGGYSSAAVEASADDVDIFAFVEDTFAHDDARVLTLSRPAAESSLPSNVLMYGLTDIIEENDSSQRTRVRHLASGRGRRVSYRSTEGHVAYDWDDVGEQPVVGALQGDDTMTTDASHPISVQEDIATFIVDAPEQRDRAAALDAVIDREPVSAARELPCLRMKKC
jgi:hypothetical protein